MNVHFRSLAVVTVFGGLALSQAESLAGEERGFYAGADVGGTTAESTSLKEFPDAPPGGNPRVLNLCVRRNFQPPQLPLEPL